jgi:hypothetical protein
MTTPPEARVIADTGGLVVTDDGRRVLVFDRGVGGLAITAFVLGVVALVVGGFGVVALIAAVSGSASPTIGVGAAFLAVGLAVAIGAILAVRTVRRRRAQPLHACRSVAVIDRKLGLFSYAGGAVLPLDQVRFERRMQIGSSSPKLVAVLPGSTRVLKRGNPFDGGIGDVDRVLTAAATRASTQS